MLSYAGQYPKCAVPEKTAETDRQNEKGTSRMNATKCMRLIRAQREPEVTYPCLSLMME